MKVKHQKVSSILQLLIGVAAILFVAGVAAPSFLRSQMAGSGSLAASSLHSIHLAGLTFSYRYQNLAFAALGALFGTIVALAIASSSAKTEGAVVDSRAQRSVEGGTARPVVTFS